MTLNILLVDDDADDVFLASKALAQSKVPTTVAVARDGQAALAVLRAVREGTSHRPDLVLLDINMPNLDGAQTLRRIRADPTLAGLPVIMLTTSDAERDILASFADGATSYLTKPLRPREIAPLLRELAASLPGLPDAADSGIPAGGA